MSELRICPQCQTPIPAAATAGLCPNCLLAAGMERLSPSDPGTSPTQSSPNSSMDRFVPPTVDELSPRFPQLEILELIGQGGMGAVYKALQRGLDRLVAVKILPPEISRDPTFAERFVREARALGRLNHPHIVAVYDSGQTADGLCYFVMEYVDGVNLRQALRAGKVTPSDALAIVPQICDALQFAHDVGVVHRDIKPENVLVDKQGRVKIADFGLAKLLGTDGHQHTLTATQQVMGTLKYMAPEQLVGTKDVDHRADIFSLGVVFYELLTGELPVGRFAPPSKKVQIDVRLDEVVLRALEQSPEQRYQHASDVKTNVEAIVHTPSGTAPSDLEQQILALKSDGKIAAVNRYMELTGQRLAEAKAAVEDIGRRHDVEWLSASPLAEWTAFVLIFLTLAGSIALAILRPIQLSSVITVPFVLLFAVVPLAIRIWRNWGTREASRDLLLIAGVVALVFFSYVVSFLSNPAPTLERIYEITGIAPGKHDVLFLQSMFLLSVFGFLIWLLKFWEQLRTTGQKPSQFISHWSLIVAVGATTLLAGHLAIFGGMFLDSARGYDGRFVELGKSWGLGSTTQSVQLAVVLIGGLLTGLATSGWTLWLYRVSLANAALIADPRERAKSLIRGPAIGLILMGLINLPVLFLAFTVFHGSHFFGDAGVRVLDVVSVFGYLYFLYIAIGTIRGGQKMWELESHGDALQIARTSLYWPTLNLFAFAPISLWALTILGRNDVRESFTKLEATDDDQPSDSAPSVAPLVGEKMSNPTPATITLQSMLGVSVGLVLGAFCATVGLLLLGAAFVFATPAAGEFWGWMGGAIGCLGGGLGSMAGSWNTFRQLRGEVDWLKSPRWTPLDIGLLLYGAVGLLFLFVLPPVCSRALQTVASDWQSASFYGARLLGGLLFFQATLYWLFRCPTLMEAASNGTASRPSLLRRSIKFVLGLVWLILIVIFFSFNMRASRKGESEQMTITVGAFEPWFTLIKTTRSPNATTTFGTSSSVSINALTWSFFAFALFYVLAVIGWRMEREDAGKQPFDADWWRTVLIRDGLFIAVYFLVVLLATTWRATHANPPPAEKSQLPPQSQIAFAHPTDPTFFQRGRLCPIAELIPPGRC